MTDELDLPPGAFDRLDESADEDFYAPARLVYHIDDHAVAALTEFYRTVLPAGGAILDLMSSWVSHLPPDVEYGAVIGHGMNAAELAANPRLTSHFTQNLNADPTLPRRQPRRDDLRVDQYLQRLSGPPRAPSRPGGPLRPLIISFLEPLLDQGRRRLARIRRPRPRCPVARYSSPPPASPTSNDSPGRIHRGPAGPDVRRARPGLIRPVRLERPHIDFRLPQPHRLRVVPGLHPQQGIHALMPNAFSILSAIPWPTGSPCH